MAMHVPSIIRRFFGLSGSTPSGAVPASTGGAAAQFRLLGVSDIDGLVTALGGKAATSHTHAQGDITGLATALSAKSDVGHQHLMEDITLLENVLGNKSDIDHTHLETEILNRRGVIWTKNFDTGALSASSTTSPLISDCPYTLEITDRISITAFCKPTVNEGSYMSIGIDGEFSVWQAAILAINGDGAWSTTMIARSPIAGVVSGWHAYHGTGTAGVQQFGNWPATTMDIIRTTLRLRADGMTGGTLRCAGKIEVIR